MRPTGSTLFVLIMVLCISGGVWIANPPATAAEPKPTPPDSRPEATSKGDSKPAGLATVPVYKPRVGLGAPGGRLGGGTRGTAQTFVLSVLAPNHTGLTSREQPVLYWYLTKSISTPMEFTLSDDGPTPLIETTLKPPFEAGVQPIRLSDYNVRLAPGKSYRWFVALVLDPERRSKDILAGGTIEFAQLPEGDAARLTRSDGRQMPRLYAEQGLWYDAVAAINELITSAPRDQTLKQERAALLQQVGLNEIAEYDMNERSN